MMKNPAPTVAVLIPVYRPDKKLKRLLSMLRRQTYPVDQVIIMDTLDDPDEKHIYSVPGLNLEVYPVLKADFDHAGTRRAGMEHVKTDVCICMTQDAIPADEYFVERLTEALRMASPDGREAAAAYARQLPQRDCRLIERYTRSFNYPLKSSIKTVDDTDELGIKTYFCSNVCAAYDMKVYRQLGGFNRHEIFNEDMIFAARLIKAGYAIVYAADARVIHSHNYSPAQQFRRNFDLAVSQTMHPEIFSGVSSESEGIRLVTGTAGYLIHAGKPWLIPELIVQSGAKYLGYRLGCLYDRLPAALIMRFTDNKGYWEQIDI